LALYVYGMPLLAVVTTVSVVRSGLTRPQKAPWVVALWLLVFVEPVPVAMWLRRRRQLVA
jgi:hypothetical protein